MAVIQEQQQSDKQGVESARQKEQDKQKRRDQRNKNFTPKPQQQRVGTGVSANITSSSDGESDPAAILVNTLVNLDKDLPAKTRLDINEVNLLTRALVICSRYGSQDVTKNAGKQVAFTFMKLKVGLGGQGRKEIIEMGDGAYKASQAKHAADEKEIKL